MLLIIFPLPSTHTTLLQPSGSTPHHKRGDCETCSTHRFHITVNNLYLVFTRHIPSSVENPDFPFY
jgi:hypothetical protein